jgi:hypothetical protein
MNRIGSQPIPMYLGPKGTSHIPPAQAKRPTTRKNNRKLFHGPLNPKKLETTQTKMNPNTKATNISAINIYFSFSAF